MTLRFASILAATALAASPAIAQDYAIESVPVLDDTVYADGAYQGEWRGDWVAPERYEGVWEGTYDAALDDRPYAPHLAYSARDRAMWLQQCRATYDYGYYDSYDRGPDGAVIGGVIGAVAGGVIGNRVADGARLGGTLLGAGLGGLAGAAIGDAVDGDDPVAVAAYPADYCESYLRDYEARAAYSAPQKRLRRVIRRPVAQPSCDCAVEEEVIEEVVMVERPVAVTRSVATKAVSPGKTTRLRSTK